MVAVDVSVGRRHRRARRGRARRRLLSFATAAFLLVMTAAVCYPFAFMIMTSLKTNQQFYHNYFGLTLPIHMSNYGQAAGYLWRYILNTLIVVGSSTILVLATSSLAGYAFARLRFPGRVFLFYAVIALLMVPFLLMLVPLYVLIKQLGLLGTFWGLILPYTALGQVLGIFIMRTFFAELPEEMFEAGRLDGASELQAFRLIAMPLAKPALATVAVLTLITTWNDYLWPLLVLTDPHKFTLTLGIVNLTGRYDTQFGPLMAGYVVGTLPLVILLVFANRAFVRGLTQGALKL